MRLALVALLAGCGGSPAPSPDTIGNAAPRADSYCPPLSQLGAWQSELFPACPAWPVIEDAHVCNGPCAKPCIMSGHSGRDMSLDESDWSFVLQYDAQQRFVAQVDDNDATSATRCRYDGDKLAACEVFGKTTSATRDASGRIIAVNTRDTSFAITYEGNRVASIGATKLRYDAAGRLVSFMLHDSFANRSDGEYTLERDAAGRVQREAGPKYEREFTYDGDDRVLRIVLQRRFDVARQGLDGLLAEQAKNPPPPPSPPTNDDEIDLGMELPPVEPMTDHQLRASLEEDQRVYTYGYELGNLKRVSNHHGTETGWRDYEYNCGSGQ